MNIGLKPVKVHAVFSHDKETGLFTLSLVENRGPIVSAPSIEEAETLFKEGLELSSAVRNLLFFKKLTEGYKTKPDSKEIKEFTEKKEHEIVYHQIAI